MKTLCRDNVSYYLFENNKSVVFSDVNIAIGDPLEYYVGDCNNSNSVLHQGVTAPSDWTVGKYMFDGTTWSANPKWVEPPAEEEEAEQ